MPINTDVMLIPHIGGRYADIVGFHDPRLERVVELYSDWGRFEWLLEDALANGYRVGFVANSDGHKGPGSEPSRGVDVRRLRRPHLRAGGVAHPRGRVRGDSRAPVLWRDGGPAHPRRARRRRSPHGRRGTRAGPGAHPRSGRRHRRSRAGRRVSRPGAPADHHAVRSPRRGGRHAIVSRGPAREFAGGTVSPAGMARSSSPPAASSPPSPSPWRTPRRALSSR